MVDTILKHEILPKKKTDDVTNILVDLDNKTKIELSNSGHQNPVWLETTISVIAAKSNHGVEVKGKSNILTYNGWACYP